MDPTSEPKPILREVGTCLRLIKCDGTTPRSQESRPPTLVVWGKYDPSFTVAGAIAYADDVPKAEVHILDAGHFALDEATDVIASLVHSFLDRLNK